MNANTEIGFDIAVFFYLILYLFSYLYSTEWGVLRVKIWWYNRCYYTAEGSVLSHSLYRPADNIEWWKEGRWHTLCIGSFRNLSACLLLTVPQWSYIVFTHGFVCFRTAVLYVVLCICYKPFWWSINRLNVDLRKY